MARVVTISLSDKDVDSICMSLNMRANYIETGNPNLSLNDLNDGHTLPKGHRMRSLTEEQADLARRLRVIAKNLKTST